MPAVVDVVPAPARLNAQTKSAGKAGREALCKQSGNVLKQRLVPASNTVAHSIDVGRATDLMPVALATGQLMMTRAL